MGLSASQQEFTTAKGFSVRRKSSSMNPLFKFKWDERREEAALLIAEGKMTKVAIQKQVGVGPAALHRWLSHPDFQSRIEEIRKEFHTEVLSRFFARKEGRIDSLIKRLEEIETIWKERGDFYKERDELIESGGGGGSTGHVVRTFKSIGSGPTAFQVSEFAVDVATIREYRALEEQIARELGQWGSDRLEVSGPNGGPITVREVRVHLAVDEPIEADYRPIEAGDRETEAQAS